jgi:hypothetical protein
MIKLAKPVVTGPMFPIFLATFMKKSLKMSDTFLGSFTMSLFSLKVIELFVFTPLLDKKAS